MPIDLQDGGHNWDVQQIIRTHTPNPEPRHPLAVDDFITNDELPVGGASHLPNAKGTSHAVRIQANHSSKR